VTDIFHADRWDYVFYRELPGDKKEQRNISVFFVQDKLDRVAGDVVPKAEAAGEDMPKEANPAADAPKAAGESAAGKPETKN
jgi:outer membrane protein assembly factor BamE